MKKERGSALTDLEKVLCGKRKTKVALRYPLRAFYNDSLSKKRGA